jgi:hypothetical protein
MKMKSRHFDGILGYCLDTDRIFGAALETPRKSASIDIRHTYERTSASRTRALVGRDAKFRPPWTPRPRFLFAVLRPFRRIIESVSSCGGAGVDSATLHRLPHFLQHFGLDLARHRPLDPRHLRWRLDLAASASEASSARLPDRSPGRPAGARRMYGRGRAPSPGFAASRADCRASGQRPESVFLSRAADAKKTTAGTCGLRSGACAGRRRKREVARIPS